MGSIYDEIKVTFDPKSNTVDATPIQSAPEVTQYIPLHGYLGITAPSPDESSKLEAIWGHFDGEPSDRLWQIRSLENRLRQPRLGESRLDKLYEYVKLTKEIKANEEKRNQL